MNNGLETRYFLSALTGAGYYALHRQFLRPPERYFCILKGGPGCGKSTFLKRVGDAGRAAGLAVVRLHCAGDPAALAGGDLLTAKYGRAWMEDPTGYRKEVL